jgi:hypothetical protein
MTKSRLIVLASSLLALAACVDPYAPTMRPDYAIRVVPTTQGPLAVPPPCPSWNSAITDPYDNQPFPQYGCANARDLALTVENPDDLVEGRALGDARGVTEVGAIRRYDNNQSRGLIWTGTEDNQAATTTASTGTSAMTGDVTGSAGASASSAATGAAAGP